MTAIDPARLIIAGFRGNELPTDYCTWLREERLGGLVLFSRNFAGAGEAYALISQARSLQSSMIVAVDQEGGRVQRLKEFPLPAAAHWQCFDEPALARQAGGLLGQFLSSVGFNMDFAPVVDVNTNPDNPVIGDRAFGDEVEPVIAFARPFAEGLHSAGVASCAKHFPGHGDTDLDSHLALPRLSHSRARLESVELTSFKAFTDLPAWMTAHILFPEIDDRYPATLSASALEIARNQLGYQGVLISDDLEMNAIASHFGYGEAAVQAIVAGCDALLVCSEASAVEQASEALRREAKTSEAFRVRVAESWSRLGALIQRFPLPAHGPQAWRDVVQGETARRFLANLDERMQSASI